MIKGRPTSTARLFPEQLMSLIDFGGLGLSFFRCEIGLWEGGPGIPMWESCSVLVPGIWSQWQNWGQAGLEEVHNPTLEVLQRFSQPWPWPALISQGSRGCTKRLRMGQTSWAQLEAMGSLSKPRVNWRMHCVETGYSEYCRPVLNLTSVSTCLPVQAEVAQCSVTLGQVAWVPASCLRAPCVQITGVRHSVHRKWARGASLVGTPAKTSSFPAGSFLAFRKKKKIGSPELTQLLRCH